MYNTPKNTLFLGNYITYVSECHSTNDVAQQLIKEGRANEGHVIITDNQSRGRGQRGTQWISEPGKNLTFTIILKPSFLTPERQFGLSMMTALGVNDLVEQIIPYPSYIKWPNDIVCLDAKICGILIENQLSGGRLTYSAVGIGLNVNQTSWSIPHVSSLATVTDVPYDLNDILSRLLKLLEVRYFQLKDHPNSISRLYQNALYRRGEWHNFMHEDKEFQGKIKGIDEVGRLIIESREGDYKFDVKEVQMMMS